MEGGKLILTLQTIVNQWTFGYGIKINSSLRLLSFLLSYMVVKFGSPRSLENSGKDRGNLKVFYNL
jgi:hypothetical protein